MKTVTYALLVCAAWLASPHPATAEKPPPDDATVHFRLPCPLSDPNCSSSSFSSFSKMHPEERTNPEEEVEEVEEVEEEEEEEEPVEESLNCLFSSVPLIGGPWLTEMVRNSFTDSSILQATQSFLLGGRMVSRVVELGESSTASRLLLTLERCLEILKPQEPSVPEGPKIDSNDLERKSNSEGVFDWLYVSPVWSRALERRKRGVEARFGGGGGYGGGYGADPLVGFNILGFLVVGALITFLIHMLV